MPDEASITIVTRMRDEASQKMKGLTANIQQQAFSAQQLQMTLTATGSALAAVGALMGQMESPVAKLASKWLLTAGAILTTTSAIMAAMPVIRTLTASLRGLAIMQTIVAALSGPIGWGKIAIGMGIAAVATGGIIALSRAGSGGGSAGGTQIVQINTQAFTGSQADARKFASKMQTIQRTESRIGR